MISMTFQEKYELIEQIIFTEFVRCKKINPADSKQPTKVKRLRAEIVTEKKRERCVRRKKEKITR